MIIANPIYNAAFNRLMEDERIAKFFIGTLLNETIEKVEIKPQEYTGKLAGLAVHRIDFVATIKTGGCECKKVVIKIQKAGNIIDLMRYRNYLDKVEKKEGEIDTDIGKRKLPCR